MAAFSSIIDDILTNNPWGCTSYEQAGVTLQGVSKASESYTGRVIYENTDTTWFGTITSKDPTPSEYHQCYRASIKSLYFAKGYSLFPDRS